MLKPYNNCEEATVVLKNSLKHWFPTLARGMAGWSPSCLFVRMNVSHSSLVSVCLPCSLILLVLQKSIFWFNIWEKYTPISSSSGSYVAMSVLLPYHVFLGLIPCSAVC